MTASIALQDLTRASAHFLEALGVNDPDVLARAMAVMTQAVEETRLQAHKPVSGENRALLHAVSGSLEAAAQRIEKMTGVLRRRRAIMALPAPSTARLQLSA